MDKDSRVDNSGYTDEELLTLIADGKKQAFSILYDRYSPRLYGLALKILQNQTLADDVIQDVFLNIWNKASSYSRKRGTPLAWMMILCRNKCIDVLRVVSKNRKRSTQLDETIIQLTPDQSILSPLEKAHLSQISGEITRAMNALPSEQRSPIEMAYFGGFSQTEISTRLKVPLGTVKTRMRLGLQKLRSYLNEKWNS